MRQLKIDASITDRESNAIRLYLKDIQRFPILNAEEETLLALRIQQGDQQAHDRLVQCNLRFVVSVAKKYHACNMELMDLISEGNIGLIHAAQKFDPTRGFRFITYAVCWIRQAIMMAICHDDRLVRLPRKLVECQHRINEFTARFLQQHERYPTPEEIADATSIDYEQVQLLCTMPAEHLSLSAPLTASTNAGSVLDIMGNCDAGNLLDQMGGTGSLLSQMGNCDAGSLLDQMASTDAGSPSDPHARTAFEHELSRALDTLPARERQIVVLTYGLEGHQPCSPGTISLQLGLSAQRIRMLRQVAISKLRRLPLLQVA